MKNPYGGECRRRCQYLAAPNFGRALEPGQNGRRKNMRFQTLLPIALGLVAFAAPADDVAFAPAASSKVHKTFKSETKLESHSMRTTVGGEEQPTGDAKISITD